MLTIEQVKQSDRQWYFYEDLAELYEVHIETARRWGRDKKITVKRLSRSNHKITREAILNFDDRRTSQAV